MARKAVSGLEETLAWQLKAAGLPEPAREYRFAPPRKFRADFAYPAAKLLIECEGAIWQRGGGGRHNRGAGMLKDMEKYNLAAALGFKVLRFSDKEINSGSAVRLIEAVLRDAG